MRITNTDVIKQGEHELFDGIIADLDWGAIEDIFRKDHQLGIEEDVDYKAGDIVVHENRIAYQLKFEVKVGLLILIDREGNYLSVRSSGNLDQLEVEQKGQDIQDETEAAENEVREETPYGISEEDKGAEVQNSSGEDESQEGSAETEESFETMFKDLDSRPEKDEEIEAQTTGETEGDSISQTSSQSGK